jgi:D-alanyl-D-alanine carboxypeptidase
MQQQRNGNQATSAVALASASLQTKWAVVLANTLLAVSLLFMMLFYSIPAHANPKYAAIVIDADTNQVLHEAHADATRYPASLTKMMTLYMTFEALQRGSLKLNQQLPVSERAASMPQTNLSLRKGDTIDVETAIKALIVRSANDVSVVLAEALGKTEWQFAVNMTSKARKLGMRNTTFRNANGLPDKRQTTTARDMATLGLALRRDFPQYYPYFKTTKVSYHGRNYNTHNHVLKDYPGADGIKTGYINMSGFNLVTSVKRDGYSVVAVVMGGRTSRTRDAHMKDLLSRSLRQLAQSRPPIAATRMAQANAPVPVFKPGTEPVIAVAAEPVPVAKPDAVADQRFSPAAGAMDMGGKQAAQRIVNGGWGIQVGAFSESRDAFMAAVHAMNLATSELKGSEITVSDPDSSNDRVYRARIANITEAQARRACRVLLAHKEACFVYRDDNS